MLVVEHDEDAIREADYIVILAQAGVHGGEIIAEGSLEDIKTVNTHLLENTYLVEKIDIPATRTGKATSGRAFRRYRQQLEVC